MIRRLRGSAHFYAIILPSIALLLTFVYLPVFWAFSKSLYDFEVGGASTFVGLGNYTEYLGSDPTFLPSFLQMGILTFFAVCVRLSVPLVVAKLIHSSAGRALALCLPHRIPGTDRGTGGGGPIDLDGDDLFRCGAAQ